MTVYHSIKKQTTSETTLWLRNTETPAYVLSTNNTRNSKEAPYYGCNGSISGQHFQETKKSKIRNEGTCCISFLAERKRGQNFDQFSLSKV